MGEVLLGTAPYWAYVIAGYVIAAVGLGGYLGSLVVRTSRARARARAVAARRPD